MQNSETRGEAHVFYRTLGPSKEDEATHAINELVGDLGTKAVVAGIASSQIAQLVGGASSSATVKEGVVFVLARIIDSADPRKTADVMAMACGLSLREGITMTDLAEKYGVTKADISKEAVDFCERMGLPPSQFMLPEASREKYRLTNKRTHAK